MFDSRGGVFRPSSRPACRCLPVRLVLAEYLLAVNGRASKFYSGEAPYQPGTHFFGSVPACIRDDPGSGAVKAIDPSTGEIRWTHPLYSMPQAGILSTAGNQVFGGTDEGQFFALDAASGKELWHANTGGVIAGPVSYFSKGKQFLSIAAGSAIFTFGLE